MSNASPAEMSVNRRLPQEATILSWVHFGDLHLTGEEQTNYRDLVGLIDEVNRQFAHNLQFTFLPGDNVDHANESEYALARKAVDSLTVPLFAIAGDHDFDSGTLEFFRKYLSPQPHYAFVLGDYRLIFLNAMESTRPEVFRISDVQLGFLEEELKRAKRDAQRAILFVHCYPSDFHQGGDELSQLIRRYRVLLVEMGHTHYNEVANDGHTIYTATRSTGQIEEGPVGFSVTNLDDGVVSWKFHELGAGTFAMITSPADAAFIIDPDSQQQVLRTTTMIHAKCWGAPKIASAVAHFDRAKPTPMEYDKGLRVWRAELPLDDLSDGLHSLTAEFRAGDGDLVTDQVQVRVARTIAYVPPERGLRDQNNAIGAYLSKGILGTQLGPNKNGKKW